MGLEAGRGGRLVQRGGGAEYVKALRSLSGTHTSTLILQTMRRIKVRGSRHGPDPVRPCEPC